VATTVDGSLVGNHRLTRHGPLQDGLQQRTPPRSRPVLDVLVVKSHGAGRSQDVQMQVIHRVAGWNVKAEHVVTRCIRDGVPFANQLDGHFLHFQQETHVVVLVWILAINSSSSSIGSGLQVKDASNESLGNNERVERGSWMNILEREQVDRLLQGDAGTFAAENLSKDRVVVGVRDSYGRRRRWVVLADTFLGLMIYMNSFVGSVLEDGGTGKETQHDALEGGGSRQELHAECGNGTNQWSYSSY